MRKELTKKILLLSIAFSGYFLAISIFIHSLSRFLSMVGPKFLPIQMIFVALLLILNSLVSSFLSNRMNVAKVFRYILLFFIVNFLVLIFLVSESIFGVFYYFVLSNLFLLLIDVYNVNFSNSLFTPLQAKSYLPLNYSFNSLALISGALLANRFEVFHESIGIGIIPLAALIIILILVEITAYIFRRQIKHNFSKIEKFKLREVFGKSFQYIRRSKLFKTLAIVLFLFVGMQISTEFKLKTVFAHSFSEENLTSMLGNVFMVEAIVAWIISTFLAKKLLFRFGVSNMLQFFPISMLVVLAFAVLFQLNYVAVFALYVAFGASYYTYYNICTKQILSVVPKNLNQPVFFLLKGFFYGLAFLFFSALLLVYTYDISLETTLNTGILFGILVLLIWQISSLKKTYSRELKSNLFKEDEYLRFKSIDLLAEKSSKNKGELHLRRLLNMKELSHDVMSQVMTSLGIIGNHQTIVDLVKVLQSNENPRNKSAALHAINTIIKKGKLLNKFPITKHLLLKTYEKLLLSNVPLYVKLEVISSLQYFYLEDVIEFLEEHLDSEHVEINANIIETLGSFDDRGIIPYLEPYLESKNLRVLRAAIIGLWKFKEMRIILIPKFVGLLATNEPTAIETGLSIIEAINATWEKAYVERKLKHEDGHIRLNALITLIKLGESKRVVELIEKMLDLVRKDEREELEFVLSHYRNFKDKTKKFIIKRIQQMEEADARRFYDAFDRSKYVFEMEESALS